MYDRIMSGEVTQTETINLKNINDGVDLFDLKILAWLSKGKRRILEIGTKHGQTTINFAKNSAPDAIVYTIDVDQQQDHSEIKEYDCYKKIKFIQADSTKFDFSSIKEKFDLIFIDGCHQFNAVISDTLNAVKVLEKGGLIVWHDFASPWVPAALYYTGIQYSQFGSYMAFSYGDFAVKDNLDVRWMGFMEPLIKHTNQLQKRR